MTLGFSCRDEAKFVGHPQKEIRMWFPIETKVKMVARHSAIVILLKNKIHPNDTFLGGTYLIEETRRAHTGHTGMETVVWIVCWADWFLLFVHMFYNVYFL